MQVEQLYDVVGVVTQCSIPSCEGTAIARGWCSKHYTRWQKHGDPTKVVMGPDCPRICRRCGSSGPFYKGTRACKTCYRKKTYSWRDSNKERDKELNREWARSKHRERREAILAHYGGRCACCGEDRPIFLAVDHKNGGGNTHRRSLSSTGKMVGSSNFYAWIVRNDFPEDFQLLCHNCNFAKGHGGCPHQLEKSMSWSDSFVAFDCETTGLDSRARIIELGLVVFTGGQVTEEWSTLLLPKGVNWDDPDVAQALSVNKISREALDSQPAFLDVFHRLFLYFRSSDVWVAHNAEFDIRMLNQEFRHHRNTDFPLRPKYCLCTKLLSRHTHPREKAHTLAATSERWGIENSTAHRASSDAATSGRILAAMAKSHLPNDIEKVHELQKAVDTKWKRRTA